MNADTSLVTAPAIESEVKNERGLSLPVGETRISASGRDMGTRINFHSDALGNPIGNISNLRKFYRESEGLKGRELTAKVESVWNQDEEKSRVYSQLTVMSLHAQGMRIGSADINKAGTIGTVKYYKAKAPKAKAGGKLEASIAKATAVKEAQLVAAENMQKLLADNGIEKTLEECFEAVKVQA